MPSPLDSTLSRRTALRGFGALGLTAYEVAEALLRQAVVLVSPGYQFGSGNEGRFRVCYARDEREWEAALGRMVEVLEGLAVDGAQDKRSH